jgi:hypothetical protein
VHSIRLPRATHPLGRIVRFVSKSQDNPPRMSKFHPDATQLVWTHVMLRCGSWTTPGAATGATGTSAGAVLDL